VLRRHIDPYRIGSNAFCEVPDADKEERFEF